MKLLVDAETAKEWYEKEGVSNAPWDEHDEITRGLLRVEATVSQWPAVHHILETGIPESAALIHYEPQEIGLDQNELEHKSEEPEYESLTLYALQNTSNENVTKLIEASDVNVLSVTYVDGYLRFEVEADR